MTCYKMSCVLILLRMSELLDYVDNKMSELLDYVDNKFANMSILTQFFLQNSLFQKVATFEHNI